MRWIWEHKAVLFIFVVSLVVRLWYLQLTISDIGLAGHLILAPDTINYLNAARALAGGTGAYQETFFSFGPGYPVFLLLQFPLIDKAPLLPLLLNILLSCLSCLLLFRFTVQMTGSRFFGLLAGIMLACSVTSIELSCALLSDTFFFFLLALGLVLGIEGFFRQSRLWAIAGGLAIGAAILTRSIGQFLPIILILIGVLMYRARHKIPAMRYLTRHTMIRLLVCWAGIPLAIEGAWVVRNMVVNDIATLTSTSAGASANVAAMSLQTEDIRQYRGTLQGWISEECKQLGVDRLSTAQGFRLFRRKAWEVFRDNPIACFKAAMQVIWMNLTEVSMLHRSQFKTHKDDAIRYEYVMRDYRTSYIELILAAIGLLVLLMKREFWLAIILAVLFASFTLPLAATMFQGSRISYPGQLVTWVLAAVAVGSILLLPWNVIQRLVVGKYYRPNET